MEPETPAADTQPLILYDRSRVVTDWSCPRKRYWNYEYAGRGIVPEGEPLELFLGIVIHDSLSAIAHNVPIDDVANAAARQVREGLSPEGASDDDVEYAHEQAALIEGLLRGFHKHAWPGIRAAYPEILFIEEEMLFDHENLRFMAKPDLVLVNRETGDVLYLEYKSTSSKKAEWINSWTTAVQVHSTIKAVLATKGVTVNQVIIQGLYKGYESYGKQNSPFCYVYERKGNPPFTQDEIRYDYKPGFKRSPTWTKPGGVAAWVDCMPAEMLAEQFPQTPPIQINDTLVERFFTQRVIRENEIALASTLLKQADEHTRTALLDGAFPQRFDQCTPGYGKGRPCAYSLLCHGPDSIDPLNAGFQWRTPHHTPEAEQHASQETHE